MRLRQVALLVERLEPAVAELELVLGLATAYRDPEVARWGLVNAVLPVGGNFLEVLAPDRPGTSAVRYLDRRGAGGYMVILHGPDALADRRRITGLGVRAVWETDRPDYLATHFHPADLGGVLLSVDSVPGADWREPLAAWPPAGPDWTAAVQVGVVADLTGVEIQAEDPAAVAARWGRVLDRPVGPGLRIDLDLGTIRFVGVTDGRGPGLGGLDLRVADRALLTGAAEARGRAVADGRLDLCGIRLNLH